METTTEDIQLQSSVFNSQEENIISPITSFPNLYRLLEESQKSQFKNELIEKEFSPPPSEANSSVSSPRSKLLSSSEFVIVDKNDVTDFEFPEQPKLFITVFEINFSESTISNLPSVFVTLSYSENIVQVIDLMNNNNNNNLFIIPKIETRRTKIIESNMNPKWNQSFLFDVKNSFLDTIIISACDVGLQEDDTAILGSVSFKVLECQQFGESISVFPLKDGDVIKGTIKLGFLYKNEIITSNFQNLKSLQTGFANLKPKERSETQETFLRGIDISESEIKVYGNNVFSTFDQIYDRFLKNENVFESLVDLNFIVLFVPGLYSGKIPGNRIAIQKFDERLEKLKEMGLDARRIEILVDGSVNFNANYIANTIREIWKKHKKKLVVIGHSKGAVDIGAAFTLNPDLIQLIKCFIAIQTPFFGSTIASELQRSGTKDFAETLIKRVLGCDPQALRDITKDGRTSFLKENPYPYGKVPTLSFVSTVYTLDDSPMKYLYKYLKLRTGDENDGVVTTRDGIIPNSDFIITVGMDHSGANENLKTKYNDPVLLLAALIATEVTLCEKRNYCI